MNLRSNVNIPFHPFLNFAFKKEMVGFFNNISLMVQSGIPLNESLGVLIEQANQRSFRNFLIETKNQVEHGLSFSKALSTYRKQIGDLALNIIKAGEINGTLDDNLKYLGEILARERDLKQRVNSALLYPKIVLTMTFFLGGGIALFVLPKLIPLFRSLNLNLPLATRILLWISLFLRDYGVQAMGGALVVFVLFFFLLRLSAVKRAYDWLAIRVPFLGKLARNYQIALFCQIFGTLFRSGLTIKEAMVATADALTNSQYKNALMSSTIRLTSGTPLGTILGRFPKLFPRNVIALIAVAERSGKLEEAFKYLASYYDNEVDVMTKQLPTLLEPIMLIVIGCVVGFVALAVISPIYALTSGISQHTVR